jgi:hypothetical protein
LKAPGFNPWNLKLKCDLLFSSLCFRFQRLYRYVETKEAELDEAAGYALQLQRQLEQLYSERVAFEAEEKLGLTPPRPPGSPGSREHRAAREQLVLKLKAENDATAAAAEEELTALRRELEQRDTHLADAASELAARETERHR